MAITARQLLGDNNNDGSDCNEKVGNGLVQARAALEFLDAHPCDGDDSTGNDWGWQVGGNGCDTVAAKDRRAYARIIQEEDEVGRNGTSDLVVVESDGDVVEPFEQQQLQQQVDEEEPAQNSPSRTEFETQHASALRRIIRAFRGSGGGSN